ncbi:MAG: hypothetical protein AAFS07_13855 [Pseudomonadota bacterium]
MSQTETQTQAVPPVFEKCVAKGCLTEAELSLPAEVLGGAAAGPADRAALASYLADLDFLSVPCVCAALRRDLSLAEARGDRTHAAHLVAALRAYLAEHPVDCG